MFFFFLRQQFGSEKCCTPSFEQLQKLLTVNFRMRLCPSVSISFSPHPPPFKSLVYKDMQPCNGEVTTSKTQITKCFKMSFKRHLKHFYVLKHFSYIFPDPNRRSLSLQHLMRSFQADVCSLNLVL